MASPPDCGATLAEPDRTARIHAMARTVKWRSGSVAIGIESPVVGSLASVRARQAIVTAHAPFYG